MKYVIGIDIGTEGTKALAVNESGQIVSRAASSYQFDVPRAGWTEQNPSVWWEAVVACLQSLWSQGIDPADVVSVGLSGQMHSSVLLDGAGSVIRNAILWNDTRTKSVCDEVLHRIGQARFQAETCNSLLPGFTLGKLLWLRDNEPQVFARISAVLMPKDFVNFRLTGQLSADVTDASGTGVFDVRRRQWHTGLMTELGLDPQWFPAVHESQEIIGRVTAEAAKATGLYAGVPVIAGAADNAASALGMGIVSSSRGMVSVGTSGVVLSCLDQPPSPERSMEQNATLHVFCHALPNLWYGMGVTLAAGASLRWFRDALSQNKSYDELMALATVVERGAEGLFYLPFLAGERTPLNSDTLRGAFFGISLRHKEGDFVRAVVEGVAYSLRDCLELLRALPASIEELVVTGGAVNSSVWLQTLADVLNVRLATPRYSEGASFGAAILAGLAAEVWADAKTPLSFVTDSYNLTHPAADRTVYEAGYQVYHQFADLLVSRQRV